MMEQVSEPRVVRLFCYMRPLSRGTDDENNINTGAEIREK